MAGTIVLTTAGAWSVPDPLSLAIDVAGALTLAGQAVAIIGQGEEISTLTWTNPTLLENGSAYSASNTTGYLIVYSDTSGNYINDEYKSADIVTIDGSSASIAVSLLDVYSGLPSGSYLVQVQVYSDAGISALSSAFAVSK